MMCMEKSCTFAALFHNGEKCVTFCQMIGRRFFVSGKYDVRAVFGQSKNLNSDFQRVEALFGSP